MTPPSKLLGYQEGNIEVVLRIEVDDPIVHKPPPKKPAPRISRHSSAASSHHHSSTNGSADSLKPVLSPASSSGGVKILKPTLENIQSNPEFWSADHSSPGGSHHRPFRSHGMGIEPRSMPGIHEIRDEVEIDDLSDDRKEEEDPQMAADADGSGHSHSDSENMQILDEDSKDGPYDGTHHPVHDDSNTLYPKIVRTNTTPTPSSTATSPNGIANGVDGGDHGTASPSNGVHGTSGYVSRRKKNRSFGNGRRISHSHSRSTGMLDIPPPSSASGSSVSGSSMFYVFRSSPSDKENVSHSMNDKGDDKGYNANASMFAQRYKRNGASHKYTDSVIGSLKNGVVSMWGSSKAPGGGGSRTPLMHYGAASVGYNVS